mmetsp:Transcript_3379/g.5574  ORF Transcript_3379/g.5574 Transcript_3379/m.5574 type:complete len:87 (-) Transcript_3379:19-279(-)
MAAGKLWPKWRVSDCVAVLDYHSFLRDGGRKTATNCGCAGGRNRNCLADEYALVNIKKGEQIRCSYNGNGSSDGFLHLSGWKEFGL